MEKKILFRTSELQFANIVYKNIILFENGINFICGASGTGKTTLLKLFNTVLTADSGNIYYKEKELSLYNPILLRQEVLLLSQNTYLADKSIKENFYEFYSYREVSPPTDAELINFLEICKVPFGLDALCTNMSGGEKKRVYLAIYLSFMPKVLMLDEVTSPLDDKIAFELFANLKKFISENGISLVVISHNSSLVKEFSHNTVELGN